MQQLQASKLQRSVHWVERLATADQHQENTKAAPHPLRARSPRQASAVDSIRTTVNDMQL